MSEIQSLRTTDDTDLGPQPWWTAERKQKMVAVVVGIIGVFLGIVDILSSADRGLRIPALIASLFLVSTGINAFVPRPAKPDEDADDGPAVSPGHATSRAATPAAAAAPKASPLIPLLLMGVAVWLGLATLTYQDAEASLTFLSFVASCLIFSRGLEELPDR